MYKLTPRQQELLSLISEHIERYGAPPTRAELAAALGVNAVSTVDQHLKALAAKGAIDLHRGKNRNIHLSAERNSGLPLVGQVAAGAPVLAEEHIETHYRVDPTLFDPTADYLLRVRGLSMKDAGILDGDLLAVHAMNPTAGSFTGSAIRSGQIVVARLDDEVTVKRFEPPVPGCSIVRLLPENSEFNPIEIDTNCQSLTIEGIAVGVIRHGKF